MVRMNRTDPKSLVDINYQKEIGNELPKALKKVTNQIVYIYGARDLQRKTTKEMIKNPIIIPNLGHNIFAYNSPKVLEVIKKCIK